MTNVSTLERWLVQLEDAELRQRRLRERTFECLCTGRCLTDEEKTEIRRWIGVLKLLKREDNENQDGEPEGTTLDRANNALTKLKRG